jgi:hypothetical protein
MADEDMINDIDLENQDAQGSDNGSDNIEELAPVETRDEQVEDQIRIEDLPLDKRLELVKNNPSPFGNVKPGLWVDAMDTINSWLAGQIEEIEDNTIKVHFDGWPHKWDEWMRITSFRVAPFRKHSVGYTGQTKVAIRKEEYSMEQYQKMIEKIDICIKNNLKGLGAGETTQFYRGEVFVALDNILGRTYEPNETEMFEVGIQFIKKAIELVCTYLKLIPDMLVQLEEATLNDELFFIDENVAVALCHTEFTEILKTIFC